ncbi:MAG: nucleotidyltransferase family protein [Candidatus Omnitrophica bacterium]|nr:nucleotidyltransferase family protein [Candidatus Omnitrophota bacterium]MCM8817102.1 nucleotidyltransferase family protein [Candidatus Omnitrophota bacterium]
MTLEEIKNKINSHREELEKKFKVKKIAIFGSYSRKEQTETSDLDILVEFSEPVGFLFFHLADYLEEILKVKIDLVTPESIKPNRRKYIIKDLTYV